MKISTEIIKSVCSDILAAVDSSVLDEVAGLVQLEAHDKTLTFSVTNHNYYVSTKLDLPEPTEDFFATINAILFLKLISKSTTDFVDISISDKSVVVTSNGTYTFPLVYKNMEILRLPVISIQNVTSEFNVPSSVFLSIFKYNSKEFTKVDSTTAKKKEIYRTHYMDDKGAITMSGGACVNNFTLEQPVKLFITDKVVKLFKLLPPDAPVKFTLGHNPTPAGTVQTVCSFCTDKVIITSVFPDASRLLATLQVEAIRTMSGTEFPYFVTLNKGLVSQSLERLLLFVDNLEVVCTGKFVFYKNKLVIFDSQGVNTEEIPYENVVESIDDENPVVYNFNLLELKLTIDNCEEFININFGGAKHINILTNNVVNIVPALK